ncbi:uncharacterized protein LOC122367999 [Amphibalanus amphitrite]|uniref:uncharacterized protein LOC122367999 n=1 Tax=Amphibalanus amphitrite TaxID=1232801 RepID=UPI001C927300|nr:uncharacterized protein LOC122367999 [Amphibalanus amphitrite]
MYEGGSCSDLGTAGPLDLKRGQLMSGRLSSSSHNIKEELTSSGAVEWPAGCGYRLPSWGAAAAPFDTIKGGVERVKVPAAELGRDRAAAYFSPGLYLSRDPLQPSGPPQRDAADQDKRISGRTISCECAVPPCVGRAGGVPSPVRLLLESHAPHAAPRVAETRMAAQLIQ